MIIGEFIFRPGRTECSYFTAAGTYFSGVSFQCCFTSTETIRLIRGTGIPGRPPRLSHSSYRALSSDLFSSRQSLFIVICRSCATDHIIHVFMSTQEGPKWVQHDVIGIKSGRNRYKNNTLREQHGYTVEVGARSLARKYDAFTCSSQVTCLVLIDNMAFVIFFVFYRSCAFMLLILAFESPSSVQYN